jgi:lysozyme
MRVSAAGLRFIAGFEGWRSHAYLDAVGVPTIGFGHTGGVRLGQVISKARGYQLLRRDAAVAESAVRRLVKVPINQHRFDALVSFVFNVGVGAFESSTLLKELNRGHYHRAADQFLRWNRGGGRVLAGLTRRRQAERALFMKPVRR